MFNLLFNSFLVVILGAISLLNIFKFAIPKFFLETVSIIAIVPVIIAIFKSLKEKEISVDFLAAVALITAYFAGEWKSAVFINLMLSSARIFDIWTSRKSNQLIKSLLKYRPRAVKVKIGDRVDLKDVNQVVPGDLLIIGMGERVAVDGIVVDGQASIDESTLTGESFPITKRVGDKVYSSTLNTSGSVLVRTEKKADESTLAQIIAMVEQSTLKKSKTIKLVNIFAKWYILATFLTAIIAFLITRNINFVLAILLVVCADDIAVSIPLTFTVAIARAARSGILIKSSDVLERIAGIDVFITDKTGTLTSAKPKIVKVETFDNKCTYKEFIKCLAIAEVNSNHPVAKEVMDFARSQNIRAPAISKFKETPGEGIEAVSDSKNILAGKFDFLTKKGVKSSQSEKETIRQYMDDGYSIIAVGVNKTLKGIVIFEDAVRPSAKKAIKKTKELGTKNWIMLTGDNKTVSRKIANFAGIDIFESNLTPKDKLDYVEKCQQTNKGKTIAMIGDGVNDAAALALADISFAMGAVGSDVAINAADVALMNDDLGKIPEAINLGRITRRVTNINYLIWAVTNAVGLVLVFNNTLSPTGAASYNFLTDFLPIINALSINWYKNK